MSGIHPDLGALGPELRKIAQTILDSLDPAIRSVGLLASAGEPGKCQQVWCPVCALAALANGEQHPLLNVVSEHSAALLAVIRLMVADPDVPGSPPDGPTDDTAPPGRRYQHIPVNVED